MRRKNQFRIGSLGWVCLAAIVLSLLSGCMYKPEQSASSSPAMVEDNLILVQHAVDKYHEQTGVLPIKNSTEETPTYERNVIDFTRLEQNQDIGSIPSNAFEKGGANYYLLVDAETNPTVKLMPLTIVQQVGDVQKRVNDYYGVHHALPAGTSPVPHAYYVDFDKLGGDPVQVKSPYSNQYLPLIMNESGTVAVDYAIDIARAVEKQGKKPDAEQDLRSWLVTSSPYVPVKSFPYYWRNDEPTLSVD